MRCIRAVGPLSFGAIYTVAERGLGLGIGAFNYRLHEIEGLCRSDYFEPMYVAETPPVRDDFDASFSADIDVSGPSTFDTGPSIDTSSSPDFSGGGGDFGGGGDSGSW